MSYVHRYLLNLSSLLITMAFLNPLNLASAQKAEKFPFLLTIDKIEISFPYEVTADSIFVSGLEISKRTFYLEIKKNNLYVTWPKSIIPEAKMSITDSLGNYLITGNLNDVIPIPEGFRFNAKEIYQLCVEGIAQNQTMCTGKFRVIENKIKLLRYKSSKALVSINNEQIKLADQIQLEYHNNLKFFAKTESDFSYEFNSQPNQFRIYQIDQLNAQEISIVGVEPLPIEKYEIIDLNPENKFISMIGFDRTIKDDRVFWKMKLSDENNLVHLLGPKGGVFEYKVPVKALRQLKTKVTITTPPKTTYLSEITLKGSKPEKTNLLFKNGEFKVSNNQKKFEWNAEIPNINEFNIVQFIIDDGESQMVASYELYRNYYRELSVRLSGILTAYGLAMLDEVNYNHWFEDLNSNRHPWLTQRLGLSFKFFNNLNDIKIPNATNTLENTPMTELRIDTKYRFTPGIWGRDESTGLIFSIQNTRFGVTQVPIYGGGFFWARSMPLVFDRLFNYIPLMRYPKWVDMEFIYYVKSSNPEVTLTNNLNINFHGKILWHKKVFGEAGFGYKQFGFQDTKNNLNRELATFYGTFGLGVQF